MYLGLSARALDYCGEIAPFPDQIGRTIVPIGGGESGGSIVERERIVVIRYFK